MSRRHFIQKLTALGILPFTTPLSAGVPSDSIKGENKAIDTVLPTDGSADRKVWLKNFEQLAEPILTRLAKEKLKAEMPIVLKSSAQSKQRTEAVYLEAFGRLLQGIAPFLAVENLQGDELALQKKYFNLALKSLENATNPQSADFMDFEATAQCLVDASFLACGILHCPQLWYQSSKTTQQNIITAFKKTRNIRPYVSNWLLFSCMIEAFFCYIGEWYDKMRIEYGILQHQEWYKGDGIFGDGEQFHFDFYNSYVIQPNLNIILDILKDKKTEDYTNYKEFHEKLKQISQRYAVIQERQINSDGTFAVIGRSIAYRGGAFHHLAFMSSKKQLPIEITPAQVRSALTAVIKKTTEHPKTFDEKGWLQIGLYGTQPSIGEYYISSGAVYLASFILLPLGLPPTDAFWADASQKWTAQKIWSGEDVVADQSLSIKM